MQRIIFPGLGILFRKIQTTAPKNFACSARREAAGWPKQNPPPAELKTGWRACRRLRRAPFGAPWYRHLRASAIVGRARSRRTRVMRIARARLEGGLALAGASAVAFCVTGWAVTARRRARYQTRLVKCCTVKCCMSDAGSPMQRSRRVICSRSVGCGWSGR
jgi:hypothetical protein